MSMVCAPWGLGPNGQTLIAAIMPNSGSQITVEFTTPICHDPDNWYGKDFEVFGNSFFKLTGSSPVYSTSDMEGLIISNVSWDPVSGTGSGIHTEPGLVSVSQDGGNWYTYAYPNGPYADEFAPTQAFAWDWVEHQWLVGSSGSQVQLDFTRPVDSACQPTDFSLLSCAQGIDLYKGSGGGTAFSLAEVPDNWPADANGRKWIQYIRVDGSYGGLFGTVVDAFTRVSHQIAPASIGAIKGLAPGTHVVLNNVVVSSETYSVGRFCYIQQSDRSAGIKMMGRVLDRGQELSTVYGDMDSAGGELVILATSILAAEDGQGNDVVVDVNPLGMPNKAVAGAGLSTTGLLVRTWGNVKSVDSGGNSFLIDDGSAQGIGCIIPRMAPSGDPADPSDWGVSVDPAFTPPGQGRFVVVTGISSLEPNGLGGFQPVIRLRDQNDMH